MTMGIQVEKTNGEQIIKLTKNISSEDMKDILNEKHACMKMISLQDHPRVIFDRSLEDKHLSAEKKELIEELNAFLINRCEKVSILFNSHEEKVKYNYKFQRKERLMKTKGFTIGEMKGAKDFLYY
jgi:hypothetical protein